MSDEETVAVGSSQSSLEVDGTGLRVRAWGDATVDVRFDGRRIWSISGAEHAADGFGRVSIDWPRPLRRALDGRARVELVDHLTAEVVAAGDFAFGSGTGRVDLSDEAGRPLSLTKWGMLNRSFDTLPDEVKQGYLDDVAGLIDILRDECGVEPFFAYGSLLGAVREGKLIGHDVDVDLGYLSEFAHPSDIGRETLRIQRVLRSHGVRVVRQNTGFLALHYPQVDGTDRNIDIFTAFMHDGRVNETNDLQMKAPVTDMLPLSTVRCEGRTWPAPAKPDRYLRGAYGPGWRVPDPGFVYHTPRRLSRMMTAWFGMLRRERNWWRDYYDQHREQGAASEFAAWVADRLAPDEVVVDVGCGDSADSALLAARGHRVVGVDFVPALQRRFHHAVRRRQGSRFVNVNLYALDETLRAGARISREPGPRAVYARRLFDDLRADGRDSFWRLAAMVLRPGGRCYLECAHGVPSGPSATRDLSLPPGLEVVLAEIVTAGGRVVEHEKFSERVDGARVALTRLVVEFGRPADERG